MRAVFGYAEAAEIILRSPCHHIRLPQVSLVRRASSDRRGPLTPRQALGPDYAPMMWMATVLGLRWAEVAGLTVRSLDLLRGTVAVTGQLGRNRELAAPKSAAGVRTMAAPRWLLDDLARCWPDAGSPRPIAMRSSSSTAEAARSRTRRGGATSGCQPASKLAWAGSGSTICARWRLPRPSGGWRGHEDRSGSSRPCQSVHDARDLCPGHRRSGSSGR